MATSVMNSVREALRKVKGPDRTGNIVDLGLVSEILDKDGDIFFAIAVPAERADELEVLRQAAEKVAGKVAGVKNVTVALTAERQQGNSGTPVRPAPDAADAGSVPPPMQATMQARTGGAANAGAMSQKAGVPGVRSIVAVASGKGGVGKSTTAVNLALALQKQGRTVGLLDADIYGPSIPRMLRITGRPETISGKVLKPLDGYGLKVMSMGFLIEEDTPMIWRGPMVMSAIGQMLREVVWGDLDALIVDMPPGTGDAQLTMSQQVPLAGAVIVSTPQDIALLDARKGLNMFRKVDVPVLGIIENMSYFLCPSCGERSEIFGHGGAREEAENLGVPFLGEIPLHMDIRSNSDAGTPVVVSRPDGPHAAVYMEIASRIAKSLFMEDSAGKRTSPRIVIQ